MALKNMIRLAVAAAVLSVTAGCGSLTDPKPLIDEFAWEAVPEAPFTAQADIAGFFRDISFLAQAPTPTLCYAVTATLEENGNTLIVRVALNPSGSTACAPTQGGFRYSGVIRNLARGTYTVRIIQTVKDQAPQEFTKNVTV